METNSNAQVLRSKIIGTLIRDARLSSGKPIEDCADAIGVPPEIYTAYERGTNNISLPELESLSLYFKVPLEHFQGSETLPTSDDYNKENMIRFIQLRHKLIGALIRQMRVEAGLSLEEFAERTNQDVSLLKAYEFGQKPIPIRELEMLCNEFDRSIVDFYDKQGVVANWNNQQQAMVNFLTLPSDIQEFVCKPINLPYLELAMRLSDMPVERLRAIAEGLLEITL